MLIQIKKKENDFYIKILTNQIVNIIKLLQVLSFIPNFTEIFLMSIFIDRYINNTQNFNLSFYTKYINKHTNKIIKPYNFIKPKQQYNLKGIFVYI